MSSEVKDKDEYGLEITKAKHQQWYGLQEILKHEFLKLLRIRDFLSLILMYPMIMPDQHLSKKWRDDAQALTAKYFEDTDCLGLNISGAYRWMHLLSEKPLKNMEALMPNDLLSRIEEGQRCIFNENASTLSGEALLFASTSKGEKVLELGYVHNVIPEAILNLAADLAVDQLIQTLLTHNTHHVMFSTRNEFEKIDVARKIKSALDAEYYGTRISNKYSRVLWVYTSTYSSNKEAWVREEIARQLDLLTGKGDQIGSEILLTRLIEVEMMRMNHLVFLVDGNGKGKVDPWKVGFPKKMFTGVVVLLTVESSVLQHDELLMAMDLEIRTEDHLMPWELFCRNVGWKLVSSSNDIQRIAVQIVEECRGHLLAIVLLARSLKNIEDVEIWKLALQKLCYLHPLHAARIDYGMSKIMVNAFVNIIWNNLNKTEKLCLACSLYVLSLEETMADHLIISSWVYNKLVCSQEEAEHILRDFVHRCIFLKVEHKYIQWPREIYNVLKSLLMLYPLDTIKKGGLGLTELQITGAWLLARRLELMDNKLSDLPQTVDCPQLTQLLLQGNANLMEIPRLFFRFMPHLHVLDLSYTSIRSLPSSLFSLGELGELHLKGCKRFMELSPEIGQLKNLEILDLDSTPITYIPEQIRELTRLKKLILSFYACHDMTKSLHYPVPPGVISKLTQLLYLSIDVNPGNKQWRESIGVIIRDISKLKKLNTLSLYIPQVKLLKYVPKYFNFRFVVGNLIQKRIISRVPPAVESKFKQISCSLRFVNGVDIPNEIFEVIQRSEALFLERHSTIKNLSQFDMGCLAHLQSFIVGECNEMETIIDEGGSISPDLCWRFLCLFYMNNLRSICQAEASFRSLNTVVLHNCPKLTSIFTLNFLDSLVNLEELIVEDCPKVRTLISRDSFEPGEGSLLPRLKKVSLLYLPELISISSGLCIGPSLERILFYDCPKLQILSAKEFLSKNLAVIKGEEEWWDALKWEESEWGKEGCPDYLHHLFIPINEETDIVDQLLEVEESSVSNEKEVWVENIDKEADIFSTSNNEKDGDESSRSNNEETLEAVIIDSSAADDVRPGKKETLKDVLKSDLHDDEAKLKAMKMVAKLPESRIQDGHVSYPWERSMQELAGIPNSGNFLSILLLPKASDQEACRYNDLEDTLARANAWLHAAQNSGIPIVFVSIQTETLLTKISGETRSLTDLSNLAANESFHRFMDMGLLRAVRLWYAPIGGELSVEIELQERDSKLGFAISRTEEGFIFISSVTDHEENLPSTRSGLCNLYKIATETSRLLVVSRVSNQKVLPWMVSSTGAIRCYDTVSIAQKLSLHRHARVPVLMHVLLWDAALTSSGGGTENTPQVTSSVQLGHNPHENRILSLIPKTSGPDLGGEDFRDGSIHKIERHTTRKFHDLSLFIIWV
ncbi:disease resistance protein At4g27190-like isoform X2 [Prosopis cineraria]|uniref:disease resistance protein At4g27190-like isoform X2 n=1 Tax=Prosopis cineraria TaxID=364024 RepID=UPI0024108D3F|nr:disease resistance protein At4g27190-like isoform X2 [Prosopis cineraria]